MTNRILITGADGFVGSALVAALEGTGHDLTLVVRKADKPSRHRTVAIGPIENQPSWTSALEDVSTIIHLANATPGKRSDASYVAINAEGTRHLVEQALASSARRLVFLSSSHAVQGAHGSAYALSKRQAEHHVAGFGGNGRQAISLRVPLVYGSQAKGNWNRLQKLASLNVPLPFAQLKAQRSLVSRENLVDAIRHLATMPHWPADGVFEVADDETVDLAGIMRHLREGADRPARLVGVPAAVIEAAARIALGSQRAEGLLAGPCLDGTEFRRIFGWTPPESAADAIRRSGREFATSRSA